MPHVARQKNLLSYKHVHKGERLARFSCFASDIGLRAGKTPPQCIETDMGNGQNFYLVEIETTREGDTAAWRYTQEFGLITLTIWND